MDAQAGAAEAPPMEAKEKDQRWRKSPKRREAGEAWPLRGEAAL